MAWPSEINPGLFVPSTNVWDVGRLQEIEVTSPEFKELLVRLYQNVNNISLALNLKDSAYYAEEEFVNGQSFPPNPTVVGESPQPSRQVFRKLIDFGALPNTGVKTVAHNIAITSTFNFTRIYGCASDQTGLSFIPLPYASPTLANNIELSVDATNVIVTTGSNRSNYTVTWVILEFLKN